MDVTGAERQKRWRMRRKRELAALRAGVAEVEALRRQLAVALAGARAVAAEFARPRRRRRPRKAPNRI